MQFVKGMKKTGGRKKGTKNKNYLDPQTFAKILTEALESQTDAKRIDACFRALELLLAKVSSIPMTPADSVANAMKTSEILKELETPLEANGESRDA